MFATRSRTSCAVFTRGNRNRILSKVNHGFRDRDPSPAAARRLLGADVWSQVGGIVADELAGDGLSSVVLLGVKMWSYAPSVQSPENPDRSTATLAQQQVGSEPSENDPAPLYDVEPFEPTYVEKGDNSYYKPPFD